MITTTASIVLLVINKGHCVMAHSFCVVCGCVRCQIDNPCTEGEICCIYCKKDSQGNMLYAADPTPGGQGERSRLVNIGGRGAPSLSDLTHIFCCCAQLGSENYFAVVGLSDLRTQARTCIKKGDTCQWFLVGSSKMFLVKIQNNNGG